MPRRVLLIAYYFPPTGMAGVQRPVRMIKYLGREGWEVWTLTVRPVSYFAEDPSLAGELDETRIIRTGSLDPARLMRLAGVGKRSVACKKGGGISLIRRISQIFCVPDTKIFWTPFAIAGAIRAHRRHRFDAVISTSSPASAHVVGWAVHQVCGIPWIMDYRDYWDGNVADAHTPPALRAMQGALESFLARRAGAVTAVSEELASIARMRGAPVVRVIRNGYDEEDFAASAPDNRNTRFTLVHGGTANRQNDIRPFFTTLHRAVEQEGIPGDALEFQQIGEVLDMDWNQEVRRAGLHCCTWSRYTPHDRYITQLRRADALVLCLNPECRRGLIPGKIYEYMATGLPLLCMAEEGETANLVRQTGRGIVVRPGETALAAQHLKLLYTAWAGHTRREPPGDHIRQYTRQEQARRMAEILLHMTEARQG